MGALPCLVGGGKYKGQHRDKDSISANISSTLCVSMSRETQYEGQGENVSRQFIESDVAC